MSVVDQFGKTIVLKDKLGAGGEGTVYRVSGRECAKIYAKPTPFKEAKILTMIAKPPHPLTNPKCVNGRVAWPTRALYDRPGGNFVGYIMPLIELTKYQESEIVFIEKLRTKKFGERFTYEHLMIAAYNFAMTVHFIHQAGHSVGDLREKNILVDAKGQVCLVDCDSFQIMDPSKKRFFASQTYTPAYLAPEWTDQDLSKVNRRGNDNFALGVWIFQMLMNGMHPYQARGGKADHAPSLSEKIKKGTYPYARARGLKPPAAAPDFDQVPKRLQLLFQVCFVNGHDHPDDRPQALAYANALKREIERLKLCSKNRNHRYSGDQMHCPFCRRDQQKSAHRSQPMKTPVLPGRTQKKTCAPPARTYAASFSQLSGMQLPSWKPSYGRGGSTIASRHAAIRFLSKALLVIMLVFGAIGLLRGLTGAAASALTPGFAEMPQTIVSDHHLSGGVGRLIDRIMGLPGRLFSDKEENTTSAETEVVYAEGVDRDSLQAEDFLLWVTGGVLYQNQWDEPHFKEALRIDGVVKESGFGTYIRPEEADDGAHIMNIELQAERSGTAKIHYGAESWWCWAPAYGQYKIAFFVEGQTCKETRWLEWDETGNIELEVDEGETIHIAIREKAGWKGTLNPVIAFE